MTDQDAFIRTICEHPFDLRPRLVFADWLDENDDGTNGFVARAEFIRVQIELDQSPPCSGSANRRVAANCSDPACPACQLRDRELQLLAVNWHEWSGRRFTFCQNFCADDQGSVGVKFTGGFPTSIRCPLDWWTGGECECFTNEPDAGCPTCHGTGRTPANGPAVVSRHPVTRVVVMDRELYPDRDGAVVWYDGNRRPPRHPNVPESGELPPDVFARLDGWMEGYGGGRWKAYPTSEAAVEALSRALVGWAREQAGLTPIQWEVSQ